MSAAHAHSRSMAPQQPRARRRRWPIGVALVAAVVMGSGVAAFAFRGSSGAVVSSTSTTAPAVEAAANPAPLSVASVGPADGSTGVPTDATVSVHFSVPLDPHSPAPSLSPSVAGTWQVVTPDTFTFVASAPFAPLSSETISIPAGDTGVVSAAGKRLAQPLSVRFTVAGGSTLRLQQLLAQLGYLPVSFTAAGALPAAQEAAQAQEGSFTWRWSEPASLQSLWTAGTPNEITRGAIMAFESQHNLKTDGQAGPAVWEQLLADAAAGAIDPNPYDYVYVSQVLPQTTTVYSNGAAVYSTRANTGVAAAPTASGTFPVYLRYKVTTMTGTNPDGSKYSDPGIPWVSYFNGGDALHGFVRGSYGYPQSVGCVEMPPANAAVVYPLTPIGTLVTVS